MDKKKGIILAVIIILIVGLSIFVFANPSSESLNENNNNSNNDGNTQDNQDLDDENTNTGDGEEGKEEDTPTDNENDSKDDTDNNGGSDVGEEPSIPSEDTPSEPSTPNEPTTPVEPEEPDVDSSYEDALAAVEKAEETLSQTDTDSASELVQALEESDDKIGLVSRLQAVQNMINAIAAVEKAESSLLQMDVYSARALISSLLDSEAKTELENRILEVQNIIDVTSLVLELQIKTETASSLDEVNEAREFREASLVVEQVAALSDSTRKEELTSTLNTLASILDDDALPVISGIEDGAIIKDTSVIKITDTNDVTIILNNEESTLDVLSGNSLKDGIYTLVVVDAAFNRSAEFTFEVDKTAPIVSGLDNGYIINQKDIVTVSDKNLAQVSINGNIQELVEGATSYSYTIASNSTYHFVVTDQAGNVTDFTVMRDDSITEVVTINNSDELIAAINGQSDGEYWIINSGEYLLPEGTLLIEGQTGWFFPITANDLTIVGNGDVTIKADSEDNVNANLATQNFVTIWGNRVEISNVTLIAQDETNKAVEILGDHAILEDIVIAPRDENDDYSGSIYINKKGITTTLTNVTLNKGRITLTGADSTNTLYLNNVTADLAGSSIEGAFKNDNGGVDIFASFNNTGGATVYATDFTVTLSNKLASVMNEVLSALPDGTNVIFSDGTYKLGTLEVDKELNLQGSSNTVLQVSGAISGQAGVYIKKSGSISNLTIEMSDSSNDALKVSGNSLYMIDQYKISDITITGGKNGINIHGVINTTISGVTVSEASGNSVSIASSNVTISGSNLALGRWGRVIAIAYKENNASYPDVSVVTIKQDNIINGPLLVNYPDVGNQFIFEDETAWFETPYDENNTFYVLNAEN